MSREELNIDSCWDADSIDSKKARLQDMLDYGNDFSREASKLIGVLEERKRNLKTD